MDISGLSKELKINFLAVAEAGKGGAKSVIKAIGSTFKDSSYTMYLIVKKSILKIGTVIKTSIAFVSKIVKGAFSVLSSLARFSPQALYESLDELLKGLEDFFTNDIGTSAIWFNSAVALIKNFISGITTKLPEIVKTIKNMVVSISKTIIKEAPAMITSAGEIVMAILRGLIEAAPMLIKAALVLVSSLIYFLLDNLPEIINMGVELVVALINGIGQALPGIIVAIAQALPMILKNNNRSYTYNSFSNS